MHQRSNKEALLTPFKSPRKIDRPASTTPTGCSTASRRRRTSSSRSDLDESSAQSSCTESDHYDDEDQAPLFPPSYPLTPPTSSPPHKPLNHDPNSSPTPTSDSDSDSLLHPTSYDLLLTHLRERRINAEERSNKRPRSRGVASEDRERVKRRPFVPPAVSVKGEGEGLERGSSGEEEDQGLAVVNSGEELPSMQYLEAKREREEDDSESSLEGPSKERRVLVREAYKAPRRIETSGMAMNQQKQSSRIITSYSKTKSGVSEEEEVLDSQEQEEDSLPTAEQLFGIGKSYGRSSNFEP